MIFEDIVGWRPSGRPGEMRYKREAHIFKRHLYMGCAWLSLRALDMDGPDITAQAIYDFLEGEFKLRDIEDYLHERAYERYAAAARRNHSIYADGLEYLEEVAQHIPPSTKKEGRVL